MAQETYNWATVLIYSLSAIIAGIMLIIALYQLSGIKSQLKQGATQLTNATEQIKLAAEANSSLANQVKEAVDANKINRLIALLDVEKTINGNRIELSKTTNYIDLNMDSMSVSQLESSQLHQYQCIENYLNSVDRLCFCLLNSYFDDEELRKEFREMVSDTYKSYTEEIVKGVHFRNIKKLYDKWADS
ncbi:hypothetical protein [Proteus mirabilis]|uniref:hypothetical protein n=1 Tax=Proteus mirabilis TaxID=584 RepID=UPI00217ECEE3|nr:hypothetical protein [Proteus mirabilis]MCS6724284.1 hypothetical protein [Proteus mirabilis]